MVERHHIVIGHFLLVHRPIRPQGVPALPGGGGPAVHLIEPAGAFLVQKQAEGQLLLPVVRQQGEQMLGGKEAGLHPLRAQLFHQLGKAGVPQRPRRDHHFQGHHIGPLVVVLHGAVRFHERVQIGGGGFFQLRGIAGLVLPLSQHPGGLGEDTQVIDNKGVGHRAVMHGHIGRVLAGGQPVPQAGANPQAVPPHAHRAGAHVPDLALHMGFHAVVLLFQIAVRAELLPHHPGQDGHRVPPAQHGHEADALRPPGGHHRGHIALGIVHLGIADILEELG